MSLKKVSILFNSWSIMDVLHDQKTWCSWLWSCTWINFFHSILFSSQLVIKSIGHSSLIASGITSVPKNSRTYFGVFAGAIKAPLMTALATLTSAKYPNITTKRDVINGVLILYCCRERFDFAIYDTISSSFSHSKISPLSLVAVAWRIGSRAFLCCILLGYMNSKRSGGGQTTTK